MRHSEAVQRLQTMAGNRAVAAVLGRGSMTAALLLAARGGVARGTVPAPLQRESAPYEPEELGAPARADVPAPLQRESAPHEPEELGAPGRADVPMTVQRNGGHVVSGLTVVGAAAVAGVADTFVAPRGTRVAVTAAVTSPMGAVLPANAVRWSAGRAGSSQLERVLGGTPGRTRLRARVGASSRTVTVYVASAATRPAPLPAAVLEHRQVGRSNPGGDFGLTVVTIGQQGVTGPRFWIDAYINGGNWLFGVRRIRHGYKIGVASQGCRNVPSAASVSSHRAGAVLGDLTPPGPGAATGPPRAGHWVRSFTVAHEQAHVDHFYLAAFGFWPPNMRAFEAAVAALNVPFHPTTARLPAQVIRGQTAGWRTDIDARHGAADAAEISTSETYAHGQSNPMYAGLVAAIRATVRPPAPTGLAAAPTAGSVTLTWNQDRALVTSFSVSRRVGSGPGPWTVVAAAIPAASGTFSDAAVTSGTRYTYRLVANSAAGASRGRTVRARVP